MLAVFTRCNRTILSRHKHAFTLYIRAVHAQRTARNRTDTHRVFSTTKNRIHTALQPYILSSTEWKLIYTILVRALAGLGLVHMAETYVLDVTQCEGPSMTPTISPQAEIVLVERFSHRLFGLADGCNGDKRAKIAREQQMQWEKEEESSIHTWYQARMMNARRANVSLWAKLWEKFFSGIAVGDVIVLEALDREGTVCKRVIGLPGDIVLLTSMFEGNRSRMITVPDGHVWVEGDNSLVSRDSRMYGPVPAALVRGKVLMKVWPPSKMTLIERSPRPLPPAGEPFTGSMVIPAGYEGESLANDDK